MKPGKQDLGMLATLGLGLAGSFIGGLIAQFFGAFNDNAWKMVVLTLGMRIIDAEIAPGAARDAAAQQRCCQQLRID